MTYEMRTVMAMLAELYKLTGNWQTAICVNASCGSEQRHPHWTAEVRNDG